MDDISVLRNEPFRPRCTVCGRRLSKDSSITDCGHFLCRGCALQATHHGSSHSFICPVCGELTGSCGVIDSVNLGAKAEFIHSDPASVIEKASEVLRFQRAHERYQYKKMSERAKEFQQMYNEVLKDKEVLVRTVSELKERSKRLEREVREGRNVPRTPTAGSPLPQGSMIRTPSRMSVPFSPRTPSRSSGTPRPQHTPRSGGVPFSSPKQQYGTPNPFGSLLRRPMTPRTQSSSMPRRQSYSGAADSFSVLRQSPRQMHTLEKRQKTLLE